MMSVELRKTPLQGGWLSFVWPAIRSVRIRRQQCDSCLTGDWSLLLSWRGIQYHWFWHIITEEISLETH